MAAFLGLQQSNGPGVTNAVIDICKALGGTFIRLDFDMAQLYPNRSDFDNDTPHYGSRTAIVQHAKTKGIDVMAMIGYNPAWQGAYHGKPGDNAAYATMARRVVRDFPQASTTQPIKYYEMWNEPNGTWAWTTGPSFVEYRLWLRTCILQMRAQDAACYIINGGLETGNAYQGHAADKYNPMFDLGVADGTQAISVGTMLWGLFDPTNGIVAGTTPGTPFLSGYGLHCYTTAAPLPTSNFYENCLTHVKTPIVGVGDPNVWGRNSSGSSLGYAFWKDIICVKEGYADPDNPPVGFKKVWATEQAELSDVNYGSYNPWTRQIQADHLRIAFNTWSSYVFAAGYCYFQAYDVAGSGDVWQEHGGLYQSDLVTPKTEITNEYKILSGAPDVTPPAVSIVSINGVQPPVGFQTVSGSVVIACDASDDITPTSQIEVKVYVDNTLIGTASPGGFGFILTWDSTLSINGTHNLVATAKDLGGNTTSSAMHIVTVNNAGVTDTTPPACDWVSIGGQVVVQNLVVDGTVSLIAHVSDNLTPTNSIKVEAFVDGHSIGQAVSPYAGGDASVNWITSNYSNGTHTVTVTATDAAGNSNSTPASQVFVNNAVILTAPVTAQTLIEEFNTTADASLPRPHSMSRARADKRDATTRGILYLHAFGGSGPDAAFDMFGVGNLLLRPIVSSGHAMLMATNGNGDIQVPGGGQWGNDTALTTQQQARTWLLDATKGAARPGKVALLGYSMGGVTSWNLARLLGPGYIAGIIGVDPVTHLSWDRGTDNNHWKSATLSAGSTTTVLKSTGGFASYMVGWTVSTPVGNTTITAFTSSTQVSVGPPLPSAPTTGGLSLVPADGAGLFYVNINKAYGGNGAEPDGVMNDAAWAAVAAVRDPVLMVDDPANAWMKQIPWYATYGEADFYIGASAQVKQLGDKLQTVKYSIDPNGTHGGIYAKPEDLIAFLNGLDWG